MKKLKKWKVWYKQNKNLCLDSFGDFIKKNQIGDMDLSTYCKYKYFLYLYGKKLSTDYKTWNDEGVKPSDMFKTEEAFKLSLFAIGEDMLDKPEDYMGEPLKLVPKA